LTIKHTFFFEVCWSHGFECNYKQGLVNGFESFPVSCLGQLFSDLSNDSVILETNHVTKKRKIAYISPESTVLTSETTNRFFAFVFALLHDGVQLGLDSLSRDNLSIRGGDLNLPDLTFANDHDIVGGVDRISDKDVLIEREVVS